MHLWTVQNKIKTYSNQKIVLAVPRMHRSTLTDHIHHPVICGKISAQQDQAPLENLTFCKEEVSP